MSLKQSLYDLSIPIKSMTKLMQMRCSMKFKLIKTEEEYEESLQELELLFDAVVNTPEGDKFELLSFLIDKYEEEHYPIAPPHPIEAIKFRREQMSLQQKDLTECFGDKLKVSEVLNLKRKLNLRYIISQVSLKSLLVIYVVYL